MKWKYLFIFGIICLFSSCNNQEQQAPTAKIGIESNELNCYHYIKNKDTVILKMRSANGLVTGTLIYNIYEKDKNTGTIEGKMNGKMLFADYTFNAEGTKSIRPVAFKKVENNFMEGYGETEEQNGKLSFKNKDSLSFEHSIILMPFDCDP
ncbi:MAG: hypothetical protein ABI148_01585 [Ginsengibacter sp.]